MLARSQPGPSGRTAAGTHEEKVRVHEALVLEIPIPVPSLQNRAHPPQVVTVGQALEYSLVS